MTTGAETRVFLARLAGIGVFDPNGDQVGKVRDGIVVLRIGANPPRLTGLVVEVQPRRRIFVPMTKVTAIGSGQVIMTGAVIATMIGADEEMNTTATPSRARSAPGGRANARDSSDRCVGTAFPFRSAARR